MLSLPRQGLRLPPIAPKVQRPIVHRPQPVKRGVIELAVQLLVDGAEPQEAGSGLGGREGRSAGGLGRLLSLSLQGFLGRDLGVLLVEAPGARRNAVRRLLVRGLRDFFRVDGRLPLLVLDAGGVELRVVGCVLRRFLGVGRVVVRIRDTLVLFANLFEEASFELLKGV